VILLVPTSPEVPKARLPRLWPGLLLTLILAITYLEVNSILQADYDFLTSLTPWFITGPNGDTILSPEGHIRLRQRPLLKIAPAKGDWDVGRLLFANFIHGSVWHLVFNLIGAFAGARLCSTFFPFSVVLSIYLAGGSLGLLASVILSSQSSEYIPHLGSSAGIFALMGAYYVYNFRFRTKYFFWFPSRRGTIALKTSWFFFLDVILLEIILSSAQLFPGRLDVVDHLAHVIGFAAGVGLAIFLRLVQRWPSFLQTRAEFVYWSKIDRPKDFDLVLSPFIKWLELLTINAYNDQLKFKLYRMLCLHPDRLSDTHVEQAVRLLSPTYIRLNTPIVATCVFTLTKNKKTIPTDWLKATPYDSVIRIARELARMEEGPAILFEFVSIYRRAHPEGGDMERKLELLMQKLSGHVPGRDDSTGTSSVGNTLPPSSPETDSEKAKAAS